MTSTIIELMLPDTTATEALGAALAPPLSKGGCVLLSGDLGAGKTTWVRAMLRALGHDGPVRSPTYAIVEPYRIGDLDVYHLDLYRIADPGELEFLGLRDWLLPDSLMLVEWPEHADGWLPEPDLALRFDHLDDGRRVRLTGSLVPSLDGLHLLSDSATETR